MQCWNVEKKLTFKIEMISECIETEGDFRNEHLKAEKTEIS